MKRSIQAGIVLLAILAAPALLPSLSVSFRQFNHPGYTRIVFEGDRSFQFTVQSRSDRLEVRLQGRADFPASTLGVQGSPLLERVTHEVRDGGSVFTVHFKGPVAVKKNFVLENPYRVVFDLVAGEKTAVSPRNDDRWGTAPPDVPVSQDREAAPPPGAPAGTARDSEPVSDPLPPLQPARPKPIETICIDPGHGGEDLGAVGRSKLQEKGVTLKIGLKLKKLIESKTGLRVIMTRDKDSEVSLNTRASIANNQLAQMFISIHANSSFRKSAYGSETYFVSLQATDPESLELAQKENQNNEDPGEAIQNDELKMILWNMAQTEHIRESSKLAEYIQNELNELLGTRNRGVKQAPFRVLMRTAMPAVLIETVFISNPSEERKLQSEDFLDKIAFAIYNGVSKFIYYYNHLLR